MGEGAIIDYIVIGVVGILTVFSVVIGVYQMIKIILGNYILSIICLAAGQSISLLTSNLDGLEGRFLGLSYETIAAFFTNGKTTLLLVLYAALLILIFKKSTIVLRLPSDDTLKKTLFIIFVPLTVLSMVLTLELVLLGVAALDVTALQTIVADLTPNTYVYQFVSLTPVWLFLHGLLTVLLTFEMSVSVKTSPKVTSSNSMNDFS